MKVLIILAAFLFVHVYGNPINAQCESQRFTTCTDTFARALGLPSMPSDADILDKQIKKLEDQGKEGQARVCKADGDLQRCLGQEYDSCISFDYLKSIGESDKDAKKFVLIAQLLKQTCVHVSANVINAQCESQRFTTCTDTFARALGLPSMPTDADILDKQIKKLEDQGKEGQARVCKADADLQSCLGQEYDSCISFDYLKSIGESDKDAKKFVLIAQLLKQTCVHVSANVINAKCESPRFTKCTDTFARALGLPSMPSDADILQKQIKSLEAKGKQGQAQVCKAAAGLQACLGEEYNECISIDYLKSIGESYKDAKEFVQISQHLEKVCVQ